MGPGSPAPWTGRQGPAGFLNHLQCLYFSQGGIGPGRKEKVEWKENVKQLFSIFPEEKEGGN